MQMKLYRIAHWFHTHNMLFIGKVFQWIIFLLFSAVIPASAKIGRGTVFAHGCVGTVLHPKAVLGERVLLPQGVTIGGRSKSGGYPVIGNDVYIGVGAKILGDITVGDNSLIGANAVVINDVPPGSLVVGIPAVVKKSGINARDIESW